MLEFENIPLYWQLISPKIRKPWFLTFQITLSHSVKKYFWCEGRFSQISSQKASSIEYFFIHSFFFPQRQFDSDTLQIWYRWWCWCPRNDSQTAIVRREKFHWQDSKYRLVYRYLFCVRVKGYENLGDVIL